MNPPTARRLPSPALIVALIALTAGLAGAAYAVTLHKGQVKTRHIAKQAVTSNRIANGAVKAPKLARAAVGATALAANAVTAAAIGPGQVGNSELADDAVTRAKIRAQAVTRSKIADGAVDAEKLADGSVTAAKLGPGAVTSASVLLSLTRTDVDPADLAAGECTLIEIPAAGVLPGDSVIVTPEASLPEGVVTTADAHTDGIGLRLCAVEAAAGVPGTDFRFLVIR